MPNIVGTLPKVPHLILIGHNWPHTSFLWPTFSWIIDPDLWPWVTTKKKFLHHPGHGKYGSSRSNGSTFLRISMWTTDGKFVGNIWTRQLPMGAGDCQWGGLTDQNVCNIHGDAHLASRYRAMLRPGTFSKFGTLPATMAYQESGP